MGYDTENVIYKLVRREPEPPPEFCPICGVLLKAHRSEFKPYHTYYCRDLRICFCDNCLSGEGGVGIICRVLEASSETRLAVKKDCESVLNDRRKKYREMATLCGIVLGILAIIIGICCLVWNPLDVFIAVGTIVGFILVIIFYNWAKGIVLW